jgi:hypothetical protein
VARARGGGEKPIRGGRGVGGAHPGLSTVMGLGGEKPATGAGTGGAGVVGDGLRIIAELVEVLAAARAEGIWWRRRGRE